jgi:hypothetical protein
MTAPARKPTPAWHWIAGGAVTTLIGLICSWFIVNFDFPETGRTLFWFLLVPGGAVMIVYGSVIALGRWIRRNR